MTCEATPQEVANPYAIAKGMQQEEAELMRKLVDAAKERAKYEATQRGYGPNRTSAHVNNEMLKAKAAAHDRFLLEQIKKGLLDPDKAHSHKVNEIDLAKVREDD